MKANNIYKAVWHTAIILAMTLTPVVSATGVSYAGTNDRISAAASVSYVGTSGKVSAPADLRVNRAGDTSLKLTWTKVRGAAGYAIYRYDGAKLKYVKIKTVNKTRTTSWSDTNLKTDKKYKYKMRAYKIASRSRKYSAYTYAVSAVPYAKKSRIVNAGGIRNEWRNFGVAIGERIRIEGAPTPSKYGTSKNKKVVDKTIRYMMKDTSIAKVNEYGVVTGKREGVANLYMIAHNGTKKMVKIKVYTHARPDYWSNLDELDKTAHDALIKHEKEITNIAAWFLINRPAKNEIYYEAYYVDNAGNFREYNNSGNNIGAIRNDMIKFLTEVSCAEVIVREWGVLFDFNQERIGSTIRYYFDEDDNSKDLVRLAPHWYYYYFLKI